MYLRISIRLHPLTPVDDEETVVGYDEAVAMAAAAAAAKTAETAEAARAARAAAARGTMALLPVYRRSSPEPNNHCRKLRIHIDH